MSSAQSINSNCKSNVKNSQLSADIPWASNTLERPEAVLPVDSGLDLKEAGLQLDLPPYSVVRVRIPPALK
jgi:alpha-L-arabinofuranosidase